MKSVSKTSCQIIWNGKSTEYLVERRMIGTIDWIRVGVYTSNSCVLDDFKDHWFYEIRISDSTDTSNHLVNSFISLHGYVHLS